MKNWSTDLKVLKKNPEAYRRWKTEQLINFGVGKEKLDMQYLKSNFYGLSLDPEKKSYVAFLLWPSKFSRKLKKNS